MNLYRKHQMYSLRRRLNQPIWQSFKMEFLQFKLTKGDWITIISLSAILGYGLAHAIFKSSDNSRMYQHKRATVAESALDSRELMIVTMLNRQYIRIDGVKRKVQLCDAANECE